MGRRVGEASRLPLLGRVSEREPESWWGLPDWRGVRSFLDLGGIGVQSWAGRVEEDCGWSTLELWRGGGGTIGSG